MTHSTNPTERAHALAGRIMNESSGEQSAVILTALAKVSAEVLADAQLIPPTTRKQALDVFVEQVTLALNQSLRN